LKFVYAANVEVNFYMLGINLNALIFIRNRQMFVHGVIIGVVMITMCGKVKFVKVGKEHGLYICMGDSR